MGAAQYGNDTVMWKGRSYVNGAMNTWGTIIELCKTDGPSFGIPCNQPVWSGWENLFDISTVPYRFNAKCRHSLWLPLNTPNRRIHHTSCLIFRKALAGYTYNSLVWRERSWVSYSPNDTCTMESHERKLSSSEVWSDLSLYQAMDLGPICTYMGRTTSYL